MSAIGIIPARYASTRLPGKPLLDLLGKTMIQRVWEGACQSTLLSRIIIATDSPAIEEECRRFGAEVIITPSELPSGTDRIAYACRSLPDYDIVVNIQGDEPLLQGAVLDNLIQAMEASSADIATPIKKIISLEEVWNPSVVKVAVSQTGRALYFSRSPIPFVRDTPIEQWMERNSFWKHIGIYAYRMSALRRFTELPPSPLERTEQLEQLRLLEDEALFQCVECTQDLIAIDTPEDAERVKALLIEMGR